LADQSRKAASSRSGACGARALGGPPAQRLDGGTDLFQVPVAALALGDVLHEPLCGGRVEGAFQVGDDRFDELVAVHVTAPFIQ
jgi:hypothetical protein